MKSKNRRQDQSEEIFSAAWYNTLRYHVVPPLFVVVFTGAAQWLGLLGAAPCPVDPTQCSRLAGNSFSWLLIGGYVTWAIVWLLVPSKQFLGPESPDGERPPYQDNGMVFYSVTLAVFLVFQALWPPLAHEIVMNFAELLACLSVIALALCTWLVIKARFSGAGGEKPLLYDFYRGIELHPRVLGCDAKQLTVSRIGIMLWQLLVIAAYLDSAQTAPDLATLVMQSVYIAKFFWWEAGYFTTLDITYDRAGYYLCWGGMVWIPALFPLSQMHLARHPSSMSTSLSLAITGLALASTALEYAIDQQKEVFVEWRQKYVEGKAEKYNIWGRPVQFMEVTYVNARGENRRSALLTSGFWGLARHCNYTCELVCSLLWCVPAAWGHSKLVPPLYFYFIAGLVAHRILRDEDKCRSKYGKYWQQYCTKVPHRFIPSVF